MHQYSRYITLGSSLFALFCFSLPWAGDLSGIDLANNDGGGFVIVAFISCLVIVVSSLIRIRKKLVIISSSIGLLCLLLLCFSDKLELGIVNFFPFDIRYGVFLTAIGFFLVIASVVDFNKLNGPIESNDVEDGMDTQGASK